MAVIKEFCCLTHGDFEGSHPICPSLGCDSSEITQVFLTPPKIGRQTTKHFDAGMRRTSDMMGISNFRSSRHEGDVSFAGRASQESKDLGMEVLWGSDVEKKMGRSFAQLTQVAQKPLTVAGKTLTRNNGMADAAEAANLTRRRMPMPGELVQHRAERSNAAAVQALVT